MGTRLPSAALPRTLVIAVIALQGAAKPPGHALV